MTTTNRRKTTTNITASNLTANNATILAGKFRETKTNADGSTTTATTIVNPEANLNLNSAFDSKQTETTIKKVSPNYLGIAAVAGGSAYVSFKLTTPVSELGPVLPVVPSAISVPAGVLYTGYSGNKNIDPNQKSFVDPLFNLRSKDSQSSSKQSEVKTNLDFNNFINQ